MTLNIESNVNEQSSNFGLRHVYAWCALEEHRQLTCDYQRPDTDVLRELYGLSESPDDQAILTDRTQHLDHGDPAYDDSFAESPGVLDRHDLRLYGWLYREGFGHPAGKILADLRMMADRDQIPVAEGDLQEWAYGKRLPPLLPHHLRMLHEESGISLDIIAARGYRSINTNGIRAHLPATSW